MNQVHQMDVFTFYKKGVLQSITFGERLFFTSDRNGEPVPGYFEKIQTCSKQFVPMGIERPKRKTEKEMGQARNSQRIQTGSGRATIGGMSYVNTE